MKRTDTRITRRGLIKAGATLGAVAASPAIVFRANAAPAAGELQMVPAKPNPAGQFEKLYLLKGDPLSARVSRIVTETGNPVPASPLPEGERRRLRMFHFNDMHTHITDMHRKKGDTHRLAQMVKRVKAARNAADQDEVVLFISGGDDHTGSIFDELMGWSPAEFVADAAYRSYSAAGLDIAVLGNHEFDRGAELLKTAIAHDATFPLLSANVHGSKFMQRDEDYVCAAIAEAKGLRIGFVGLTTAVDTRTGQDTDPGLAVASPVRAIENVLPAVAEVSDIVVILSHCGYGTGTHMSGKSGADRKIGEGDFDIARAAGPLTDKPVLLIGGHSHTRLNQNGINPDNMVAGVLLTQANANGKFLGEIALSVAAQNGRRGWYSSVALHKVKKRDDRVSADDPRYAGLEHDGDYDQEFEQAHVQPLIRALDGKLAEQIGRVEDAGKLVSAERTIADRYMRETAIANFMNDAIIARSATFPSGRVDLSLFNATGLSAGVAEGPLTFRQWYDVMPFADGIHVATMTGRQIKQMLDNNAKRVLRPEEVSGGKVSLSGYVSRGFLHFSEGLRYRIDFGANAGAARAVDITILGKPLEEVLDQTFTMAINTYIALGAFGEAWNGKKVAGGVGGNVIGMDLRKLNYFHTGLVYRNEIIAHIRETGVVSMASGARLDGRLSVTAGRAG